MSRRFLPALLLATAASPPPPAAPGRPVSRQQILEAMAAIQGYDLRATTNGARFQSEVLRRLVHEARARDPEQRPLFIGHEEWFSAYLERAGLSAEGAPLFIQLAHRFGQDMQIDYRTDRVVADVPSGPAPVLAVNVCIWWPAQQGAADSYYPDGRTEKDLPAGRPDLAALDAVLKRPLAVRYRTMPCPP